MTMIAKAKYFAFFDMIMEYNQVEVNPFDKTKTVLLDWQQSVRLQSYAVTEL